jgi:hypothetical protein
MLTFHIAEFNLLGVLPSTGRAAGDFLSKVVISSYRRPSGLWVGQTFGRWAMGWVGNGLACALPVESLLPPKAATRKGGEAQPIAFCPHPIYLLTYYPDERRKHGKESPHHQWRASYADR